MGDGPEDQWFRVAFRLGFENGRPLPNGTYELCGPHIQQNPEHLLFEELLPHGRDTLSDVPRDYAGVKTWLADHDVEGIVWHHPDGRMVKIKKRDFGLKR